MKSFVIYLILFYFFLPTILLADNDSILDQREKTIYTFKIHEEIAPPVWRKTKLALQEAEDISADIIIIDMNTYGGAVVSADSIRTAILNCDIPVYVFINNNAASAGALISISCDSIYMKLGANIGAATVVNQTGQKMPDKYQSYMRSTMRSTAEATGRNPQIAEAMVDSSIEVPGVSEKGKVLTFTTQEAIKNNFCEAETNNIKEIIQRSKIKNYKIVEQQLTNADKIIGFFINPVVSGFLIMIIIGGLYFELQSPGIGFPLAASVLAALLYFSPLYIEGLAQNWEVMIFVLGVILVALEIFVIPGFGVAGISGGFFIITGLTLSMVENTSFTFSIEQLDSIGRAFFTVVTASFISIFGSIYLSSKLYDSRLFEHISLNTTQKKSEGFSSSYKDYENVIGKHGVTISILRPSGKIIIDNEIYDAFSDAGFIEKNENIVIVGYNNAQLKVRKE